MAEGQSMIGADVVANVLAGEHGDLVRETVAIVAPRRVAGLASAEEDLLAFLCLPPRRTGRSCGARTRSSAPTAKIGRRTDVVGICPNDQAAIRLACARLSSRATSGWSGAATCPQSRSRSFSSTTSVNPHERRCESSSRPEAPTVDLTTESVTPPQPT